MILDFTFFKAFVVLKFRNDDDRPSVIQIIATRHFCDYIKIAISTIKEEKLTIGTYFDIGIITMSSFNAPDQRYPVNISAESGIYRHNRHNNHYITALRVQVMKKLRCFPSRSFGAFT